MSKILIIGHYINKFHSSLNMGLLWLWFTRIGLSHWIRSDFKLLNLYFPKKYEDYNYHSDWLTKFHNSIKKNVDADPICKSSLRDHSFFTREGGGGAFSLVALTKNLPPSVGVKKSGPSHVLWSWIHGFPLFTWLFFLPPLPLEPHLYQCPPLNPTATPGKKWMVPNHNVFSKLAYTKI